MFHEREPEIFSSETAGLAAIAVSKERATARSTCYGIWMGFAFRARKHCETLEARGEISDRTAK